MNPDIFIKYAWIGLICVIIVAVLYILIIPNTGTRSTCTGFQYFIFLSQKMTENSYQIELLNGPRDVHITGLELNDINLEVSGIDVTAGESFILSSSKDPTDKKSEEVFGYKLVLSYDMLNGIKDNKDISVCTGKIQ